MTFGLIASRWCVLSNAANSLLCMNNYDSISIVVVASANAQFSFWIVVYLSRVHWTMWRRRGVTFDTSFSLWPRFKLHFFSRSRFTEFSAIFSFFIFYSFFLLRLWLSCIRSRTVGLCVRVFFRGLPYSAKFYNFFLFFFFCFASFVNSSFVRYVHLRT